MRYIYLLFLVISITSCSTISTPSLLEEGQSGKDINKGEPIQLSGTTSLPRISCDEEVNIAIKTKDSYFNSLLLIENDIASQKDWNILHMLTYKECNTSSDFTLDSYDSKICPYYSSGKIDQIQGIFPDVLDSDILLMKSLYEGKNYCQEPNDSCSRYFFLSNAIKSNNLAFPKNIDTPKITFYVYKKLFPKQYSNELKSLFIKTCEKNPR